MSLALHNPSECPPAHVSALDRRVLDADVAALRAEHGDDAAFRKDVVERFRVALRDGRAAIIEDFVTDHGGLRCASRLAALEDEIIRSLYDYVVRYIYPLERPSTAERLCVVAVGGYGRATLAPGSDIDLLFLLPYKQTPWGESVVEAMLYVLWDLRQKVGHSTRSVDECVRQAKADMTIRTALLEARFVLGDAALFDDLQIRFDKEVVAKTSREFVAAKMAERETRIARAGASRYLVEPNVKEGKGGLRDLNTLFWIAKYAYRVGHPEALVGAGLFTAREFRLFCRCEEFLWRVRCELHVVSGRAEERLSFDYQRRIAGRLGYGSGSGLAGVERFMKHYFLVAKNVGDLTAIVCAAIEEREAKQPAVLDRFVQGLRRRGRTIPGTSDFQVEFERITVARRDVFERDPVNMIRLFAIADLYNLPIHPDATRLVTLSLRRVDRSVREDPEANRLFMDVLTSRRAPETALRRMNEAGVLGRFIPEFGRIVALMQFNMYHHYTVDEHQLRAVGILADIDAGRARAEHPLSTEIMPTIVGRNALYLAVFLHDVAKGKQADHSLAGAALARRLAPRFGLSPDETDLAAWLVEQHLVMSNTAQSRDLNDRRTIETFAGVAGTMEQLKCLLILTICDIKAVGPGVWNGWKGQLLRTLYTETETLLSGDSPDFDRNTRVLAAQDQLRPALPEFPKEEFDAYVARHYAPYWLRTALANRVRDARLIRTLWQQGKGFAADIATDRFRSITELTVVAPDHPRLLSIITGACASAGANIVDAQIYTTKDGLALDTVSVSRAFEQDADELRRGDRIASGIERALRGQIRLSAMVAAKDGVPKGRAAFALHPKIIVDNAASRRHTVLQVSGVDRPGLLYDLTRALSGLNLNIASAHVATFGEKAVDSFYVSDLTGAKITDPGASGDHPPRARRDLRAPARCPGGERRSRHLLAHLPQPLRLRLDFRAAGPDIGADFEAFGDMMMIDPADTFSPEGTAPEADNNARAEPLRGDGAAEPVVRSESSAAVEALQAEVASVKDRILRTMAEMENMRRRTDKEVADAKSYGVSSFAREMVSAADNLQRALASLPSEAKAECSAALQSFIQGVELTERDLLSRLARFGVKPIETVGQRFDPNRHEALFEMPDESVPTGTVVQQMETGYVIGERVLRPAKVGVSRGGPKAETAN